MKTKKGTAVFVLVTFALLLALVSAGSAASGLTPKEQVGKFIYFDETLSLNENQACASCHTPNWGWTGPDSFTNAHGAVYEGSVAGMFGDRKPPSAAYATTSPIFHFDEEEGLFIGGNFWDGRATGERLFNPAAEQALGPFLNPVEQALPEAACVVYKVCTGKYGADFVSATGASCDYVWPKGFDKYCRQPDKDLKFDPKQIPVVDATYDQIGLAIAAFEGSSEVNAFSSKFDAYLAGAATLTEQEAWGLQLFIAEDKGNCAACHPSEGVGALFTDYSFDNLGVPPNPENPVYMTDPAFVDPGLGGFLETRDEWKDMAAENMGKHKVPTLRNVALKPGKGTVKAFGHNGYFKSLESIVNFYNTRDVKDPCPLNADGTVYTDLQAQAADCWPAPEVIDNLNSDELGNLGLTPEEEAAIVAFLGTLSDGYFVP